MSESNSNKNKSKTKIINSEDNFEKNLKENFEENFPKNQTQKNISPLRNENKTNNPSTTDPIENKTNCGISDDDDETINATGKKRGKYWVSAYVGDTKNIVSLFCDSAADLSICGEDVAKLGVRKPLMNPMTIRSFDNISKQTITETVTLKLHFGNLIVSLRFYVCSTTHPIIGIDLWRNSTLNLSLNTATEKFLIGKYSFTTKPSEHASVEELVRRKAEYKNRKKAREANKAKNWARMIEDRTINQNSIAHVTLETDMPLNPELDYVFISMFDNDDEDEQLSIPCIYLSNSKGKFTIPIENKTNQKQKLKKTSPMGEVKRCGEHLGDSTVLAFNQDEIEQAMKEIEEEDNNQSQAKGNQVSNRGNRGKTINSINSAQNKQTGSQMDGPKKKSILKNTDGKNGRPPDRNVHFEPKNQNVEGERSPLETDAVTGQCKTKQKQNTTKIKNKTEIKSMGKEEPQEECFSDDMKNEGKNDKIEETNNPVKFSTMVGLNKVSNETLIKCLKDGIEVDLKMEVKEADIGINEDPVNIEEEIKRSQNCPYWPDKEAYLAMFDLSSVEEEYLEETKILLWNFRKCFFNEDTPEMFRKGIEMTPIEIKMKKGEEPTMRHPPRRMNDEKLAHLKQHLKTMLERNVIEELKDGIEDVYLNPVVMVIESRFYAKEKKRIIKSRFCLDLKCLNQHLATVQYPLPYTDEYIKNLSQPEFDTFTNLDLTSFFYQMNVTTRSAKKYLAFKHYFLIL